MAVLLQALWTENCLCTGHNCLVFSPQIPLQSPRRGLFTHELHIWDPQKWFAYQHIWPAFCTRSCNMTGQGVSNQFFVYIAQCSGAYQVLIVWWLSWMFVHFWKQVWNLVHRFIPTFGLLKAIEARWQPPWSQVAPPVPGNTVCGIGYQIKRHNLASNQYFWILFSYFYFT